MEKNKKKKKKKENLDISQIKANHNCTEHILHNCTEDTY